jgi:hypothetical protein
MASEMVSTLSIGVALDEVSRASSGTAVRRASEDAVRIALRLRDCAAADGGRLLLFVPASSGDTVDGLVFETTLALGQVGEGPILVLDLTRADGGRDGWLSSWPIALDYHAPAVTAAEAREPGAARAPVVYAQPIASPGSAIAFLASPTFGAVLSSARRRFAYVIFVAGPVCNAAESLVAAALCDGVVLSVTADRTTLADVQSTARQLAGARAPVLGFVVAREASRRARA